MRRRLPWGPALLACALLGMSGGGSRPAPAAPVESGEAAVVEGSPEGFDRVTSLLVERAPGWEHELRESVALAIVEESARAGLDPLLVVALIEVESEFEADAASVMGARGLMQLRPATARWVAEREGVEFSPELLAADVTLNVRLGVRYLGYLLGSFRGRLDLALMAYNAGPNRLRAALRARSPLEWQSYVRAVRREYAALKSAHGEPGDWALASFAPFDDARGP